MSDLVARRLVSLGGMVLALGVAMGCAPNMCVPYDGEVLTDAMANTGTDAAPVTQTPSCPVAGELGCGSVVIPGGRFNLGDDTESDNGTISAGTMTISTFALDATEVTVARFRRFWMAAHPAPTGDTIVYPRFVTTLGGPVTEPYTSSSDPDATWSESAGSLEAHPINDVDWYTAQAFCVWDGGRLPTETEWEYAARGWTAGQTLTTRRPYPWGTLPTPPAACAPYAQWNHCAGDDGNPTKRVGSFPSGTSGGIYDLAGNVWEWTADWFEVYGDPMCWCVATQSNPLCINSASGFRTVRGGAWYDSDRVTLRAASRSYGAPAGRDPGVGFRCARSL